MKKYLVTMQDKAKDFVREHPALRATVFYTWGVLNILQKRRIFRITGRVASASNCGKKVLLFALRTIPTTNLVYVDALFGHAFRALGCEVKMLYCDGVLGSCDTDTVRRDQRLQCSLCKSFGPAVKKTLRLPCYSFSEYINARDIASIRDTVAGLGDEALMNFEYLGVDVGKYAKSATIRYFLEAVIDVKDPRHVSILREKLINSMMVTKIASEVHRREKPEIIFMLHGIYSTWGPFYKFFRINNVDVVVFNNRDERFGHSIFNRNACQFDLFAPDLWKKFSKEAFSDERKKKIVEFLDHRFNGRLHDSLELYSKTYNKRLNKQFQLDSLDNKKYTRRYILFSNVFWDAVVEDMGSFLFPDIIDWINKNVGYFVNKPEYQLIIKPHPGELGGSTGERSQKGVADYIALKFSQLPDNINILPADTPLRAYDLFSPDIIGLTFNGTLGLEMATQGVPVLVAGNCHYKEAGVVYSITSAQEYFDILSDPGKLREFARKNVELAQKYAYYYFFKTMVRLPLYKDNEWSEMDWKTIKDTERLFSKEGGFMKIFGKIVDHKDVLAPL